MSHPTDSQKEYASTYFVQDRSNQDEMTRLEIQDQMLTVGMGGVLPELADPTLLRRVLDVGCGTGGWLRETARAYPMIEKLVGADISSTMMAYARTQAKSQGLDDRVEFKTMDALRILEFPPSSFDLVNQRLGFSWLRTWEWAKLLQEYQRVSRPGGIIRITEPSITATYEHSPALTKLNDIALETCYRSGRLFVNSADGVMCEVVRLMTQHEIRDVQSRVHTLVYQAGTAELQHFCDDMTLFYRVGLPYFQKWTNVPSDYQDLYQQALKEMQQPDFVVTSTVLTAWGKSPPKKERTSQTV